MTSPSRGAGLVAPCSSVQRPSAAAPLCDGCLMRRSTYEPPGRGMRSTGHLRVRLRTIESINGLLDAFLFFHFFHWAAPTHGWRLLWRTRGRRACRSESRGGRSSAPRKWRPRCSRHCARVRSPVAAAARSSCSARSATNAPPPSARARARARSAGGCPMQDTVHPFHALRCQHFSRNRSISGPAYGHDKHSGMSTQRVEPGRPAQPGRAHPRPAARTRPGSRTARGRTPPRST